MTRKSGNQPSGTNKFPSHQHSFDRFDAREVNFQYRFMLKATNGLCVCFMYKYGNVVNTALLRSFVFSTATRRIYFNKVLFLLQHNFLSSPENCSLLLEVQVHFQYRLLHIGNIFLQFYLYTLKLYISISGLCLHPVYDSLSGVQRFVD